ncbi:MAG: serpin family protein [Firmicutes bacterium]|nr:serpin family protein [Bacillota bacterium]
MPKFYAIILSIILIFSFAGCNSENNSSAIYNIEKIDARVTHSNTEFALDIFKQLNEEDSEQSVFISPLSIATALTMTYQGAGSTTKEAMAQTLYYKDMKMEVLNESYTNLLNYLQQVDNKTELNINNSIWIREGEDIKKEFIDTNEEAYNAYVAELDFSRQDVAARINRWIDEATKGKIDQMLKPPISPEVIMYLINAIYFKGEWAEQFDKKNTFNTEFHAGNGKKINVMMMSKKGEVEYAQGNDYKAIKQDYGNGKISMYLVLPNEGMPVNDFIADMTPDTWQSIKDSLSPADNVLVRIPRFTLEYGIKNLNDSLSALGMTEAFSGEADFSGIREGIFISRVLHKAMIEVNEEGSEAAAATVVEMKESAVENPKTFVADKPFVFIIEDNELGTVLFMGKLWDVD